MIFNQFVKFASDQYVPRAGKVHQDFQIVLPHIRSPFVQLHHAYTIVNAAFPVVSPVLDTASSMSDSTLSILSGAAVSAKGRGLFVTGVDLYDRYKPAAVQTSEAALQYLSDVPIVALAVPLVR
jgi:hypothetical protein